MLLRGENVDYYSLIMTKNCQDFLIYDIGETLYTGEGLPIDRYELSILYTKPGSSLLSIGNIFLASLCDCKGFLNDLHIRKGDVSIPKISQRPSFLRL